MTLVFGHSNMDADCLGSVLLARFLYPGSLGVRTTRLNPLARRLLMLDDEEHGLRRLSEVDREAVTRCIVVDTHSATQAAEILKDLPEGIPVHAIDHHAHVTEPIPGTLHLRPYGSNCAVICELLMELGITVDAETATVALAGIYADTGNFTHDNVHAMDFAAARWLVECGAKVRVVRKLTNRLPDDNLMNIFHDLVLAMEKRRVHGFNLAVASLEIPEQTAGLALVVERLHEVEQCDGTFCVFTMQKEESSLIVARSNTDALDVADILGIFGGGGHRQAASALVKKSMGVPIQAHLFRAIEAGAGLALCAADLMEENPPVVHDTWTLLDAALFLEERGASGAPVLGAGDALVGMLSLRDIQKARKANALHGPVKAYMSRKLLTVTPDTAVRDIEHIFVMHEVSRLPVIRDGNLVGLLHRARSLRRIHEG